MCFVYSDAQYDVIDNKLAPGVVKITQFNAVFLCVCTVWFKPKSEVVFGWAEVKP